MVQCSLKSIELRMTKWLCGLSLLQYKDLVLVNCMLDRTNILQDRPGPEVIKLFSQLN